MTLTINKKNNSPVSKRNITNLLLSSLITIIQFLSGIFVYLYLTKNSTQIIFGESVFLANFAILFSALTSAGSIVGIYKYNIDEINSFKSLISQTLIISIFFLIFLLIYIYFFSSIKVSLIAFFLFLFIPLLTLRNIFQAFIFLKQKYIYLLFTTFFSSFLSIFLFLYFFEEDKNFILLLYVVANSVLVFLSLLMFVIFFRNELFQTSVIREKLGIKNFLKLGLFSSMGVFAVQIPLIANERILSKESFAIFAFCFKFFELTYRTLITVITSISNPIMASKKSKIVTKIYFIKFTIFSIIILFISYLFVYLFFSDLLLFFHLSKWIIAEQYIKLIIVSALILSPTMLITQYFMFIFPESRLIRINLYKLIVIAFLYIIYSNYFEINLINSLQMFLYTCIFEVVFLYTYYLRRNKFLF
jgi:O-antigen/teichoic acid export membrane protein